MAVLDPTFDQPTLVVHGMGVVRAASTGDALLDAIHALHTQSLQGLQPVVPAPPEIDWSVLLEPSDASDYPAVITLKAVGLPDYGDPACNLVLIG